ncbi:glycosyltransferase family 4 protein [Geminicoccaceae bacterium 1502E]|nr:glycosyltransferase family 4 protein [Geminicoccaceae bacterium 1502E]
MKIAVAQLGARMHYAVPRIFHEAGLLERLFTDSYAGNKPWLRRGLQALPGAMRPRPVERWLGRHEPRLPPGKVRSFELLGWRFVLDRSRARDTAELRAALARYGQLFVERVAREGVGEADTVWGFDGSSLELFKWAEGRGLRCVLEQTMAPRRVHRRLMTQEIARWPGWQPDLEILPEDDPLAAREEAEWALADTIICGSEFVVDGIRECGGPVEKCRVVPYGVDPHRFGHARRRQRRPGERLRVLFAGEAGLRKGAPYLLEALRLLGEEAVEARFAGTLSLSVDKLDPFRSVASFLGPVPRRRMQEVFAWADLFVLPSLCEGSATVTYEAVASGLPVVCTANTGALESEAVTVVPAGTVEPLAEAIRAHLEHAGPSPVSGAVRGRYGVAAYGERLLEAVCGRNPPVRSEVAAA